MGTAVRVFLKPFSEEQRAVPVEVVGKPEVAPTNAHLLTMNWRAAWADRTGQELVVLCLPLTAISGSSTPQR